MKYVNYDKTNGKILGYYDSEIHKEIPTPKLEITQEEWQIAINMSANHIDIDTKKFSVKDFRTLKDIRKQKLNDINNFCNQAIISGFKSPALGSWHFYYSTLEEQSTLNSLITLGVTNNFKAQKISIVDEKEVKEQRIKYEHTIEQLREVLKDGATHIAMQIEKKDLLENQIKTATTVEELESIVW